MSRYAAIILGAQQHVPFKILQEIRIPDVSSHWHVKQLIVIKAQAGVSFHWVLLFAVFICAAGLILIPFCKQAVSLHRNKKKIDQLQQLFGVIAHDLRSPFKTYQGLVELLAHYSKKQDWNSLRLIAQELEDTSRNLDLLLETLFHWHLLEGGNFQPKIVRVSVANVLEKIIPIYQQIAKHKESFIDYTIDNCMNVSVEQTLATLIFRNLIDNAVKYAPRGSTIAFMVTQTHNTLECAVSNPFHPRSLETVSQLCTAFSRRTDSIQKGIGVHFMLEAAKAINATLSARMADNENKVTITLTIPFV
jgi:K+-sensing histidine kinase KdpD